MKKILFMAVMAIIGVQFSLAQIVSSRTSMTSTTIIEPERKAEPKREIQISNLSIYAGVGYSSIRGDITSLGFDFSIHHDRLEYIKSTYSYKLGAAYDMALGESISFIPAVELAQKGFKSDGYDAIEIKMTYLQIPMNIAYKWKITDNINAIFKAGPYVSYGLFGSDFESAGYKANIFDYMKKLDFGFIGGIGVELKQMSFGVEISRGLVNIYDDSNKYHDSDCDNMNIKNKAFGIVVGYKL